MSPLKGSGESGGDAKRRRLTGPAAVPEELAKGTIVLYHGDKRGIVTEAYAPIDEFWISDQATGQPVRDDEHKVVAFSAKDLKLEGLPEPWPCMAPAGDVAAAKVLLIGKEQQMLEILLHAGMPNVAERRQEPIAQQLLAVPCASCQCGPLCSPYDAWSSKMCNEWTCPLSQVAVAGLEEGMMELGKSLRRDLEVRLRPFGLKQAIEHLGADLQKLQGFYCLSAVTAPFGRLDIDTATGLERRWREQVRCQLDLGVSACGTREASDTTTEAIARRALAGTCGVSLPDELWSEASQYILRQKQGVDLPFKIMDGKACKVFILLLPEEAETSVEAGLLKFSVDASVLKGGATAGGAAGGVGSIHEWVSKQEQFKDLPKLPTGWIRVRSSKNGEVYYWDTRRNRPTFEFPLPEGWTKQTSSSTGKVYYFNAKKRKSTFEIPTE